MMKFVEWSEQVQVKSCGRRKHASTPSPVSALASFETFELHFCSQFAIGNATDSVARTSQCCLDLDGGACSHAAVVQLEPMRA